MTNIKIALSAAAATLISACSGAQQPSFDELFADGRALYRGSPDTPYTDVTTLPTQESANFEGFMIARATPDLSVSGEMEMTLSFEHAQDPIDGRVYNVIDSAENAYEGELALRRSSTFFDGTYSPKDFLLISAEIDGILVDADGNDFIVDARLDGNLVGEDYGIIPGRVVGSVGTNGDNFELGDGRFVVER